MADTTREEAARCGSCEEPGKLVQTQRPHGREIKRGTKVEVYQCENPRCKKGPQKHPILGEVEGDRWLVQINPDGSIPPRGTSANQAKRYDIMEATTSQERERARQMLEMELRGQTKGDPR